jgi:hypothetical protein
MSFKFPLPDSIVKLIDKADREKLGLKTMDEHIAQAEVKSERDLHKAIANLLRLRGIEFFESRMDRKTTQAVGVPDFVFAVSAKLPPTKSMLLDAVIAAPLACGWEVKIAGRPLSESQQAMFRKLTTPPNAWCCRVIRSVDDALAELKRLGL